MEEIMVSKFRAASIAVACVALTALSGCASSGAARDKNVGGKKAILVVSFGTSFEESLKANIEASEKAIAAAYPDYEIRRAFTSGIVIKVLGKRGVKVDAVEEALARLHADGFSRVVVQPLHLIPGEEYNQLLEALAPFRPSFDEVAVGVPLMYDAESYFTLAKAIAPTLPKVGPGEAVVFMGHGTHHPANAAYPTIQRVFDDLDMPVYVGTVEGYPTLDGVMALLERDGVKKVTLMPLMLVAGDHANNDMAGDEDDSWKTVMTAKGFTVECVLRGLGELPSVRELYVANAGKAIASLDAPAEK